MTRWFRYGLGIGVGALLLEVALVLPVSHWAAQLVEWIRGAGAVGVAVYAGAYIAATLLMLPGSLLTAGAGVAYGPIFGTLLASPLSVAAATLAFLLGRTVARRWVATRIRRDARFSAIDAAIGRHGFKVVALLRLSPVLPFNLLNYVLGLTSVRLRGYVAGSFVGMLPGTLLYVYLGSLVSSVSALGTGSAPRGTAQQILYWAGLGATVVVTFFITRIARRALEKALPRDGTGESWRTLRPSEDT